MDQFSQPGDVSLTKGNLAWSGVWSDEFTIEFDVIVTSELTDTWHNIFHVTTGDNCCKLGDRIPAVWANKAKHFHISLLLQFLPFHSTIEDRLVY